jgi:uncharacterized protein (DUF1330 family)
MAAYIVSVCEFTSFTPNLKEYAAKSAQLVHQFGGKYIVRSKPVENVEGDKLPGKSMIIVEFPTMERLQAYLKGDEYQKGVRHLRQGTGVYDIAIYESPPPEKV